VSSISATWGFTQENGASGSSSKTDLGTSGNLFNFKGGDTAGTGNYTTSPVTAGTNSFDVWLLGKFTGTFNKVNISALYKSTLINGESLKRKAMATLRKAISHLQRLNERTPFLGEATVRSA
jgi:hypothetical protein